MIDIIIQIARVSLGLLFALFLPGYLLTLILFKKDIDQLERFVLSVAMSVCIDVLVGLSLGLNEQVAGVTGGITGFSVWISLVLISTIFFLIHKLPKIR